MSAPFKPGDPVSAAKLNRVARNAVRIDSVGPGLQMMQNGNSAAVWGQQPLRRANILTASSEANLPDVPVPAIAYVTAGDDQGQYYLRVDEGAGAEWVPIVPTSELPLYTATTAAGLPAVDAPAIGFVTAGADANHYYWRIGDSSTGTWQPGSHGES